MMTPLQRSLDTVARKAGRLIRVYTGIRTNGTPHAGTLLTLAYGFFFARELRSRTGADVQVRFQALDNATTDGPQDNYRNGFWQTVSTTAQMHQHYLDYLSRLSIQTGIPFQWSSYSEVQLESAYRKKFLQSLRRLNEMKQFSPFEALLPSKTLIGIRFPCPDCGLFEKEGKDVSLKSFNDERAEFESLCPAHGKQAITVTATNHVYLNLTALYRNIVKEAVFAESEGTSVVVKASDWMLAVMLVDRGLDLLNCPAESRPDRLLVPLVVTSASVKLSKSGIRQGRREYRTVPAYLLDALLLRKQFPDYPERLLRIAEATAKDDNHSFLTYTSGELDSMLRAGV